MAEQDLLGFGIPAATVVAVCEKGHIDDFHGPDCDRCSRCGGATENVALDGLARRFRVERTSRQHWEGIANAQKAEKQDALRLRGVAEEKVAALIAAVEEHERDNAQFNAACDDNDKLYERVRSISEGGSVILSKPIRKQILASRRWHRRFWLHRMTGIPMRRLRERDREFQRQLDLSEEVAFVVVPSPTSVSPDSEEER